MMKADGLTILDLLLTGLGGERGAWKIHGWGKQVPAKERLMFLVYRI